MQTVILRSLSPYDNAGKGRQQVTIYGIAGPNKYLILPPCPRNENPRPHSFQSLYRHSFCLLASSFSFPSFLIITFLNFRKHFWVIGITSNIHSLQKNLSRVTNS